MFCAKCGAAVAEGSPFCGTCGQPVAATAAATAAVNTYPAAGSVAIPATGAVYAGFWLRFVAIIIDFILVGIAFAIPSAILFGALGMSMGAGMASRNPGLMIGPALGTIFMIEMIAVLVQWLYFAMMESSSWQATVGKKALGLMVTDMDGRRISFGRATGRYFAKIISGMILMIGYLMAGFTEKKQALHDMMAGCLVVRKL
jgi:uncharacterized RDD family membrane protein YckC